MGAHLNEINHRYPTIRFTRTMEFEYGVRVVLCWNGARAANGDGIAAGGAIDYETPLAGPLDYWPGGPPSVFGGGYAHGGYALPGGGNDGAYGWGAGAWGAGPWGQGTSFWEWTCPFALRDGVYQVAVVFEDHLGNRQAGPGQVVEFRIAAVPRPARDFHMAEYDADLELLTYHWFASPDFLET